MIHYRHGRPQRVPKNVEVTPEVLERIRAAAGEELAVEDVVAFEVQLYDTQPTELGCECFDKATLDRLAEELRAGCTVELSPANEHLLIKDNWVTANMYGCDVEPIEGTDADYRLVLRAYLPAASPEAHNVTAEGLEYYVPRDRTPRIEVRCATLDRLSSLLRDLDVKDYPLELIDTTAEHIDVLTRLREPYVDDIHVARVVITDTTDGFGLHDLVALANRLKSSHVYVSRKDSTKHFRMQCFATEIEPIEGADGEYRLVAYTYKEFDRVIYDDLAAHEIRAERNRIDAERRAAAERRKEHLSVDFRRGAVEPFDLSDPQPEPPYRELRYRKEKDEIVLERRESEVFGRNKREFGHAFCEYVEPTPELLAKATKHAQSDTPFTADDVFILRAVMGDTRHLVSMTKSWHLDENGKYEPMKNKILRSRAAEYVRMQGRQLTKHVYGKQHIRVPGGSYDLPATVFDAVYEPIEGMDEEFQLVAWWYVPRTIEDNLHEGLKERRASELEEIARLEAEYYARRDAAQAE